MRDINRIDGFCEVLKDEWKKVPDWRFGQFMCNFLGWVYSEHKIDPFFVEDSTMKQYLKEYFNKLGN